MTTGVRVLSQRGILRALTGGNGTGGLEQYLSRLPNASAALTVGTEIEFALAGGGMRPCGPPRGRHGTVIGALLNRTTCTPTLECRLVTVENDMSRTKWLFYT